MLPECSVECLCTAAARAAQHAWPLNSKASVRKVAWRSRTTSSAPPPPLWPQVVVFGDVGVLRLTADASVPSGGDRRRVNFAFSGGYVQLKAFPVRTPAASGHALAATHAQQRSSTPLTHRRNTR